MKRWLLVVYFIFFAAFTANANTFEISLPEISASSISSEFEVTLLPVAATSISSEFEISLAGISARAISSSFLITMPSLGATSIQSNFLITLPDISATSIQTDFLISLREVAARVANISVKQPKTQNTNRNSGASEGGNTSTIGSNINEYGPWCDRLATFMIEQNKKALADLFDLAFGNKDIATIKREYIEDNGYSNETCQKLMQAIASAN